MSSNTSNKRISFASTKNQLEYPDFLEVQLKSFKDFFQLGTLSRTFFNWVLLQRTEKMRVYILFSRRISQLLILGTILFWSSWIIL